MRINVALVAVLTAGVLHLPAPSDAACTRKAEEGFVEAAHRCVGWLQHPDQDIRVKAVTLIQPTIIVSENTNNRNELAVGLPVLANQFFSTVAEVAVDRARKQGLAVVHRRIQNGVCEFPPPAGLSLKPPLLPDTCELIKATDLLSLLGQARAFRTAITKDIVHIADAEFTARFGEDLPPLVNPARASFSLIRRLADEPGFSPSEDDVRPIAEAFLNAPWATKSAEGFKPIVTLSRALASIEVGVSAARVYILAKQMRAEEELAVANRRSEAADQPNQPNQPNQPAPQGPPAGPIDIVAVIDLQRRLCPLVFVKETTVCPGANLDLLEWTNVAVRAAARLTDDMSRSYKDSLRSTATVLFDSALAIQQGRKDENKPELPDPKMAARLATIRWARTIALSAIDIDPARLISAMAEYAADAVGTCNDDCGDRRKTAALLGGIAAYSLTYAEAPPANATEEQRTTFLQAQQTARKEALESVIDAATDRSHRAGERLISLGTGVGFNLNSQQRISGASFGEGFKLQVPLGVAWQRLPSPGWRDGIPLHVMFTALDLGNYVSKNQSTQESVDWQAIFAPGIQIGIPLSTSPSHFFVAGGYVSYLPRFKTTSTTVQSATTYGAFINFYVPMWDFN